MIFAWACPFNSLIELLRQFNLSGKNKTFLFNQAFPNLVICILACSVWWPGIEHNLMIS